MVSVCFIRCRGALRLEIVNSLRVVFDTNEICYILLLLIDGNDYLIFFFFFTKMKSHFISVCAIFL